MNDSQYINSQQELEELIERYFNGMTTVEEEAILRSCLARSLQHSHKIEDAQMVLGYFAAMTSSQRRSVARGFRQRLVGIAASIAIIIAAGSIAFWHMLQPGGVCIAYVNGHVVQDNDQVMALVSDDMNLMSNAANAMTDQLSSLGEALEIDNE